MYRRLTYAESFKLQTLRLWANEGKATGCPRAICGLSSIAEVHLGILINQKRKMKNVGELTQVTRKKMMMVERQREGGTRC
jgi:hypothetical protein